MSGLYIQRDLKYQGKSANLVEPLKVLEPEDELRAEGKNGLAAVPGQTGEDALPLHPLLQSSS